MKRLLLALVLAACSSVEIVTAQLDQPALYPSRDYGQRLAEVEWLMALKRRRAR